MPHLHTRTTLYFSSGFAVPVGIKTFFGVDGGRGKQFTLNKNYPGISLNAFLQPFSVRGLLFTCESWIFTWQWSEQRKFII